MDDVVALDAQFLGAFGFVVKFDGRRGIDMLGSSHGLMEPVESEMIENTGNCFGAETQIHFSLTSDNTNLIKLFSLIPLSCTIFERKLFLNKCKFEVELFSNVSNLKTFRIAKELAFIFGFINDRNIPSQFSCLRGTTNSSESRIKTKS